MYDKKKKKELNHLTENKTCTNVFTTIKFFLLILYKREKSFIMNLQLFSIFSFNLSPFHFFFFLSGAFSSKCFTLLIEPWQERNFSVTIKLSVSNVMLPNNSYFVCFLLVGFFSPIFFVFLFSLTRVYLGMTFTLESFHTFLIILSINQTSHFFSAVCLIFYH